MSRALDGDLDGDEMAELSAHLACCAPCRTRATGINAADNLFRELDEKHSVPLVREAAFARQVMKRVRLEAASAGGVREFIRLVVQTPDLRDQLRPSASTDAFVESFVSLAWQRGYRFGSGEVVSLLAARRAANDDLSDEQLDAVVGGASQADAGLHALIDELLPNWFK
ncbi:MAG: zf-HC2 domain-containing protein [Nitrosomonadales bacterium]|nr:zf-HC2 domain-containing protein [Nitrosomonadales bacterium]